MPLRFDRGELSPAHETAEGYLYVSGYATRAGVFPYRDKAGGIRWELRPPEEVGAPESLASLARKPITDQHPDEPVDASNVDVHGAGIVDPEVVWEKDFANGYVKIRGTVTRKSAVDSIKGGRRELSCGYTAEIEERSGVWTDASGVQHKFDAIQRNIRYNHLALVDQGRAGPLARLRADSDAVLVDNYTREDQHMKTIKINGRVYSLDEATAIQRAIADMEGEASEMSEEKSELMMQLEELRKKIAELEMAKSDLNKKLEDAMKSLDMSEGMSEEMGEDMSEEMGDRQDWFDERLDLLDIGQRLGIVEDMRAERRDNAELKREIVLTRFDAAELKTDHHVDMGYTIVRKDALDAPVVASASAGGSAQMSNAILGGRPTRREDVGEDGEDRILAAQRAYNARFAS